MPQCLSISTWQRRFKPPGFECSQQRSPNHVNNIPIFLRNWKPNNRMRPLTFAAQKPTVITWLSAIPPLTSSVTHLLPQSQLRLVPQFDSRSTLVHSYYCILQFIYAMEMKQYIGKFATLHLGTDSNEVSHCDLLSFVCVESTLHTPERTYQNCRDEVRETKYAKTASLFHISIRMSLEFVCKIILIIAW